MNKYIKSIKEFERTCIIDNGNFTLSDDDIYIFPMTKKFNDLAGKKVNVKKAGYYTDYTGKKNELYFLSEMNIYMPWWYFSDKKKNMEIE